MIVDTNGKPLSAKARNAAALAQWQDAIAAYDRHPATFETIEDYARWKLAGKECRDGLAQAVEMLRAKGAKGPVGGGPQVVSTPRPFFDFVNDWLRETYGARFGIDLAATAENALCARYFTEADNALVQPWHKCTNSSLWGWNNPPFGNLAPWVKYARAETILGARLAQLLKMAIGSDWFQTHVKGGLCVVRRMAGRLPFIGYGGASANFDTAVICWDGQPYREEDWDWRTDLAHWAIRTNREADVLAWYPGMRAYLKAAHT